MLFGFSLSQLMGSGLGSSVQDLWFVTELKGFKVQGPYELE